MQRRDRRGAGPPSPLHLWTARATLPLHQRQGLASMRNRSSALSALARAPVIRVWRHRDFALMMSGIGPYYTTGWIQRIAIGWLAWDLSGSPAWLGAVAMGELAPMLLISPFAGALVDRWDPAKQMKLTLTGLLGVSAIMGLATFGGVMTIDILFALALINGALISLYNAARQTLVPASVPRSDYPSAVSLDSALFHGSRFIGPILAALVIKHLGIGYAFLIHVAGCAIFILNVTRTRIPPPVRKSRPKRLLTEVLEGVRYVRNQPGIVTLFITLAIVSTVARPIQDFLPGFADVVFKSGVDGLAMLASSLGLGALSGATWIAMRGHTRGMTHIIGFATLGMAAALLGFTGTEQLLWGATFAMLVGFALTVMSTGIATMTQMAVSDDMRGRVMSLYAMIYRGMPAFGTLAIGLAAESLGLRVAFAVAAAICLGAWLVLTPRAAAVDAALNEARR